MAGGMLVAAKRKEWAGTAVGYLGSWEILRTLSTCHVPATVPSSPQAQAHSHQAVMSPICECSPSYHLLSPITANLSRAVPILL